MDLDAILDQALLDMEKEDLNTNRNKSKIQKEKKGEAGEDMHIHHTPQKINSAMDSTIKNLSKTVAGNDTINHFTASSGGIKSAINYSDQQLMNIHESDTQKLDDTGKSMMDDMISQFEELGEREDYNDVIDGVMEQLLSKELMYEPAKMMCERYPEWLATHKHELTEIQYQNYGKQYQAFQRLIHVYDNDPDNYARIMELMYDIQQYEQPPAEIIKDLAPGLKFDENGIPIMANMGTGLDINSMFNNGNNSGNDEKIGGELPDLGDLQQKLQTGQCIVS